MRSVKYIFAILLYMGILLHGSESEIQIKKLSRTGKNVLVLHSYSSTYIWTEEVTRGIKNVFESNEDMEINIYLEYLDAKRYPGDRFMEKMHMIIEDKYRGISDFDAIIASDNQALVFMMRYGGDIFQDVPVIYCGINYLEKFKLSEFEQYTGIAENIRPDLTISQILNLQPKVKKIMIVSDCNTKTAIAAIHQTRKLIGNKFPGIEFIYPVNSTMEELKQRLGTLNEEYAVLLVIYNMDKDGNYFEVDEAAKQILEAVSVPVYACWDFYMGYGIIGGAVVSGYDQGGAAAEYTVRILRGESPQDLPVINDLPVRYEFDWEVLKRFELSASRLKGTVKIINEPKNYFKENWRWIVFFIVIIAAMVLYIINLLVTQRKLEQNRSELRKKDVEWNRLANSLPGLVFRMDLSGRFLYINASSKKLLQMDYPKLLGKRISDLNIGKRLKAINEKAFLEALNSGEAQKVEFNYEDKGIAYAFETNIQPEFDDNGDMVSLLGIVYDLSDRFKAELQLQESEKKATEARKIARLGYWELDIENSQINWSSEISDLLNIKHEPEKQSIELLCHLVGIPSINIMKMVDVINKSGENKFDNVHSLKDSSGAIKWIHQRGEIVLGKTGEPIYVYGTVQDISQGKLAEQQIRSSEEKFRAIFNNAPMGISLSDRENNFIYYNPAQLRMTGYEGDELENLKIIDLIISHDRSTLAEKYESLFAGELNVFSMRKRIIRKDGSHLWTLATVAPLYSEESETEYALTMEIDISERMLAEQKMHESQQLLEQAQKIGGFGYWKFEPWFDQIVCSEELQNILGYEDITSTRISKAEFSGFLTDRDRVKFEESLNYCLKKKGIRELAVELRNKNGEELQANIRMLSLENEEGRITVLGTFIDLTLMKSIEFRLKRSEERFLLFFENSPFGVILLDENDIVTQVNPATEKLFSTRKEDIYDTSVLELLHKGERFKFKDDLRSIKKDEKSLTEEYLAWRNDNNLFWCSVTMAVLEGEDSGRQGVILLIEDINEQKLAREKLRESEEQYRSVFEVSQDGLLLTDMDSGTILDVNKSAAVMFGYSQKEMIGMQVEQLVLEKDKINDLIGSREMLIFGEKGLMKSGELFPMEIALNYFVRDYKNYHFAAIRNISERMKYEEELKESEKKFRTIIENAPLGIIFVDKTGRIRFNNSLISDMFRINEDHELVMIEDVFSKDDKDNYKVILEEVFQGSRLHFLNEQTLICHDGTDFFARILISVAKSGASSNDYAIIMIQDITEKREAEQKVYLYEKLQSIGQLAGMIAHDFNNQLMGILGYASILQEKLEDEKLRYYAGMINSSAERSAALTRKLLSFARKGKHLTLNLNVHNLIKETIDMISATIQPKIETRMFLHAKQNIIAGDPGQLQNALLNLILNACDAMPDGGILTVSTDNKTLEKEDNSRFFESVEPGRYLEIVVADNGLGIDEEIQEHIFEPFFTTKREGKGTGLGLPAVFGTIKAHQGYLSYKSKVNSGTSFYLYFQLAEVQVEEKLPNNYEKKSIHGSGTVMVIDDEEVVRKSVKDMLSSLGYTVLIFADGAQGIAYYKKNWKKVDIVLLDVIMPGMEGPEVYKHLKKIHKDVRVLLFSAYSSTREVQNALDDGVLGFIRKPVLRNELSQKIWQAVSENKILASDELYELDESENVDLNKEFISQMDQAVINQFREISSHIIDAVESGESQVFKKIILLLDLFVKKTHIHKARQIIKELKKSEVNDKEHVLGLLQKLQDLMINESIDR